jgi:hypothetical protein
MKPTLTETSTHWVLSTTINQNTNEEQYIRLMIKHAWTGDEWNTYHTEVWTEGDNKTLLTTEEYLNMIEQVESHEGVTEAEARAIVKKKYVVGKGMLGNDEYWEAWKTSEALKKRWEAMLALGLFEPSITP